MEPHGVLPVSIFWPITEAFGGRKAKGAMTGALFIIPIIRHVYTWLHGCNASKNLVKLLKGGTSVNLCPGGVREVAYLADKTKSTVFLKKRLGFTKLAMTNGAKVVPTYTFGQDKLFDFYMPRSSFFLTVGRKLGLHL